jgi:hypothetical protein
MDQRGWRMRQQRGAAAQRKRSGSHVRKAARAHRSSAMLIWVAPARQTHTPSCLGRTIYNMCTQKPPYDYSEQLYGRYREAINSYINDKVRAVIVIITGLPVVESSWYHIWSAAALHTSGSHRAD